MTTGAGTTVLIRSAAMLMATLMMIGLSACSGPDHDQSRICGRLAGAFHDTSSITDLTTESVADSGGRAVATHFKVEGVAHWVACRFAGAQFDKGRIDLEAVATDITGPLSPVKLALLRVWAGLGEPMSMRPHRLVGDEPPPPPAPQWQLTALFFAQQVINAATLACVYGLLAIGYTLVYGVLGQVNLAMGELTMIGAMVSAMGAALLGMFGWGGMPLGLLAVFAAAMLVSGGWGWTLDRVAFRPLHRSAGHAPLIVAVGVAIAAREAVRLLQGGRDWWPVPVYADTHTLFTAGGFALTAITAQLVIVWLVVVLYSALAWIIAHTAYGRMYRACSDDVGTAALMGVDVDGVVARTFLLAGLYAGAAGAVIALYYGGVSFFTGYLVGFKALTAAVVGGIGSVPGAMLGGAVLALVETAWSGYFPIAYKDVVIFVLLAAFLLFRPHGLLGHQRGRGD